MLKYLMFGPSDDIYGSDDMEVDDMDLAPSVSAQENDVDERRYG